MPSHIRSYDVGSTPFFGDLTKFTRGALLYDSILPLLYGLDHPTCEPVKYFEERVLEGFVDKAEAGIEIPNYPQFRDMTKMFLDPVGGLEKTSSGYVPTGRLTVRSEDAVIPEVKAIEVNSREIGEKIGGFEVKVCVTGPYTLSSFFADRSVGLFGRLADVIAKFISKSIYRRKRSWVELVSVDEPVFGLSSDPLIDHGSEGKEDLLKAWESVFHEIRSRGVKSCIHLHNTTDESFWDVGSLEVVESHVDDVLYRSSRTRELLEKKDKFLKACTCVADFDELIRESIRVHHGEGVDESTLTQGVADAWRKLRHGGVDPLRFLETSECMRGRLVEVIERFGAERVPYAGPECGLRNFPTYESAMEYLSRSAEAVKGLG